MGNAQRVGAGSIGKKSDASLSRIPQKMIVPTRAAIVAVIALLVLPLVGLPADAADSSPAPSAETLRSQADAIAARYFDALAQYQSLDREISDTKQTIDALTVRARAARADARVHALAAYRASSSQLSSIVGSEDALNAARRVRLIDHVNARDQAIYHKARTVTKQLNARRRALEADHQQQADALAQLQEQSDAMEAKLALAQQQEQAAAEQAARAASLQTVAQLASGPAAADTTPPTVAPATTAPAPTTTLPPSPPPPAPAPPPSYVGSPGSHPMHEDPFLTCVRARESGGNYGAVNPAGPYLGAYQFLQATWNATANHAGRSELVGVPPNYATPYDQDDLAWSLYQWRGTGPWGGGCP